MTVKIDSIGPNIFPAIENLDAQDAGRNAELFFECRIEGKPTRVTVKLSYEQRAALVDLLESSKAERHAKKVKPPPDGPLRLGSADRNDRPHMFRS